MAFSPSRLTVARKRRGLTMAALARVVELSPRIITAYESGDAAPSPHSVDALSRALAFRPSFFAQPEIDEPIPAGASFRAFTTMRAAQRDMALAAGALAMELNRWIESRFTIPEPDLPDLRGHEPEAAAEATRAEWRLGDGAVPNMVHLLEAHGVRVFSLAEECRELDAYSFQRGGRPYVFLNTMKSAERGRFDAAHELGHLLLHRHGGPVGRAAELEADRFASAFLMPRRAVIARAPRVPSIERLIALKQTWNVSVAALAHRLHALHLLTDWHYRQIFIEMGERGMRRAEPNPSARETSQVLAKVFDALRADGITKAQIAREIAIPSSEIDALVFGLTLTAVRGLLTHV